MIWKAFLVGCSVAVIADAGAQPADSLHEFKRRASTFNSVITLPQFEITTNEVRVSVKQTIAAGNAAPPTQLFQFRCLGLDREL